MGVKKILVAASNMKNEDIQRKMVTLLRHLENKSYKIDLMLYNHVGELMQQLPFKKFNLLDKIDTYECMEHSLTALIKEGHYKLAFCKLKAYIRCSLYFRRHRVKERQDYLNQFKWKYILPNLPAISEEYDVAISYMWPHYFVAYKVEALTKIAWLHEEYDFTKRNSKHDLEMWQKFNYIVAVSTDIKEQFISTYPSLIHKVLVIEDINSPEFIKKMTVVRLEDLKKNEDVFNVLTIGHLCFKKGIDEAVKALSILKSAGNQHIRWYIIKEGVEEDEDEIKKLIGKYGLQKECILLGYKENPYPYMKACDVYVQPSRYEGKSRRVLEAQMLGKPIIVTDHRGVESKVKNGVNGVICEMDAESIAKSIDKIYREPSLTAKLCKNLEKMDFNNTSELNKLYSLIGREKLLNTLE